MKKNEERMNSPRAGFSMVEVLVASTILIVIVMMLGLLFQQTSLAWRIGFKRTRGFMQVRAAVGAIQRDAAAAVDANEVARRRIEIDPTDTLVGNAPKTPVSDQTFSGNDLRFYTLSGTNRALTKVIYRLGSTVIRTEWTLQHDGTKWAWDPGPAIQVVEADSDTTVGNVMAYPSGANILPKYITFGATVKTKGANLDIGAASAGPDGVFGISPEDPNGKDDIKTWVDN